MFRFIVKYFGFLKVVPLLPHLFDTQLRLWALVSGSEIPQCLDDIEAEVLTWPGTTRTTHKYGGMQFNYKGKELGHIHSNGLLDMLFTRKIKEQLIKDGRVSDHHTFIKSGWISFYIRNNEDAVYAQYLLKTACLKNNSVLYSNK